MFTLALIIFLCKADKQNKCICDINAMGLHYKLLESYFFFFLGPVIDISG